MAKKPDPLLGATDYRGDKVGRGGPVVEINADLGSGFFDSTRVTWTGELADGPESWPSTLHPNCRCVIDGVVPVPDSPREDHGVILHRDLFGNECALLDENGLPVKAKGVKDARTLVRAMDAADHLWGMPQ